MGISSSFSRSVFRITWPTLPKGDQPRTFLDDWRNISASGSKVEMPVVESVPSKVSGVWVLKGTRMPVSAIFENIEAGQAFDDILE